jgi:hypothetical protein
MICVYLACVDRWLCIFGCWLVSKAGRVFSCVCTYQKAECTSAFFCTHGKLDMYLHSSFVYWELSVALHLLACMCMWICWHESRARTWTLHSKTSYGSASHMWRADGAAFCHRGKYVIDQSTAADRHQNPAQWHLNVCWITVHGCSKTLNSRGNRLQVHTVQDTYLNHSWIVALN